MRILRTLRHNNRGFSAVEILIVFVVVGLLVGAGLLVRRRQTNIANKQNAGVEKSGRQNQQNNADQQEPDLIIYNFGFKSFDSIDINSQATRTFSQTGHKGLYVFGDLLPGTPVRHNPNFEFASMKKGTPIIAAIDGVVGFIKDQPDSKDSEVFLMTNEKSNWIIGYDHLTNVKVSKGDTVKVGDILGEPSIQNNGLYRFEFQVNKNKNGQDGIHVCPSTLLAASVKNAQLQGLEDVQKKWETHTGLELYDLNKQQPIGCIEKQMTPAHAMGQE